MSMGPVTTLAAVLRSGRTAPALALAGAAIGLAACGSSDEGGTIPPEDANAMLAQVDRVESNVEDGNCSLAAGAVSQLRDQVDALPAETGAETKGELFRLVDNLGELVDDPSQCEEPETGATGDTAAAPALPDMSRDTTGMGGMGDTGAPAGAAGRDTASGGNRMHPDTSGAGAGQASNERNQTESGVTDSSGHSTLGENAAKTRPDQGQPVTSKGDTINAGVDSTR